MRLFELLNIVESYTRIILRESTTELWTEDNNKTIIDGKRLCEVLHIETKPYENYEVIGVAIEDEKLYVAIYNKPLEADKKNVKDLLYEHNIKTCEELETVFNKAKTFDVIKKKGVNVGEFQKDLEVLQQHKDIEEELSINLITLFKALKNGIFTYKEYIPSEDLIIWKGQLYHKPMMSAFNTDLFMFDNYGTKWALTKEELEDD